MSSILQVQQGLASEMQQLATIAEGQAIKPAAVFNQPQANTIGGSFEAAIRAIDTQQHRAGAATAAVSRGESDDLVGAMVQSQRASISFTALMEVRNKVASAFDEIWRMPV
ncbi:flagellar hook-basal body protein FliE [Alkalilimnicola ehrlichii]|uniref:Flagellar hook-basal body complex protein FliE n=1 Tax=Alkalilimnicola ehrlichii TaxID=351052 RepID=A0A3E0WZ47_9GAMM|nr:flagellar hook-basal body complex protein FliE [Alkalilimnicola ehrlichii]RFA30722.1 flagellar hook-basal body protein FliE [Alkalilimnicola ehrlichii]RFA38298.1 flagellar hook-basal body protein FliE [Alkalilimnicola ehrlichii]